MERETTRIRKIVDYGILCGKCGKVIWGSNEKGRDYNYKKHLKACKGGKKNG